MFHGGHTSRWAEFFFDTRKRSGAREIVCARREEGEVGERERGCQKVGKSRDKPLSFSLSLPDIAPSCARFLRALSHRLNERKSLTPLRLRVQCSSSEGNSITRARTREVRSFSYIAPSLIRRFRGVSFHSLSFTSMPPLRLGESGNNGQTPRAVGGREGRRWVGRLVGHWGFKRSNSTAPAVINNRKVPLPSALPPSLPAASPPSAPSMILPLRRKQLLDPRHSHRQ